MEINTATLLPYILDLLSRQPDLCCSIDELCAEIKDVVMDEVISPYGSLHRAVEFSVELGMNMGLLSLTNKRIRIPFRFFSRNGKSPDQREPEEKRPSKKIAPRIATSKRRTNRKAKPKARAVKKATKYCPVNKKTNKRNYKASLAVTSLYNPLVGQIKQRKNIMQKPHRVWPRM